MLKYEIEGGHLPALICYPGAGQTLRAERGSMSWLHLNMGTQTNPDGGFKKTLGRFLSGESIFNEYTPWKRKCYDCFCIQLSRLDYSL